MGVVTRARSLVPAAAPTSDATTLDACLRPDGQVALLGSDSDPAAAWQVVGCAPVEGTSMCFVRAELAGASWTTLIRAEGLPHDDTSRRVTVARQAALHQEPLTGWILFC